MKGLCSVCGSAEHVQHPVHLSDGPRPAGGVPVSGTDTRQTHRDRYLSKAHAMQTGVALEMAAGVRDTEPKHLRVGINSAMCDHAALVRLLIEKGVITDEEYVREVADEMEREVARYEERLSQGGGPRVRLG